MVKKPMLDSEMLEDIFGDMDAINNESRIEAEQISLAAKFAEFNSRFFFQSVDDLFDGIYDMLEDYIPLKQAIKIIDELNAYVVISNEMQQRFLERYGKTSNKYRDLLRIQYDVGEINPMPENVWDLKRCSPAIFEAVLRLACSVNSGVIKNKAMCHMAMQRFYILALMDIFMDKEGAVDVNRLEALQYLFIMTTAVKDLEIYYSLNDDNALEKLLKISMSANKKGRIRDKYANITELASKAWAFGCELLHTQMLLLLMLSKVISLDDRNAVNTKLKKIAPANRLFGPGQKKVIDTCPCCKGNDCPIVKELNLKKRFDLPVSGKMSNMA